MKRIIDVVAIILLLTVLVFLSFYKLGEIDFFDTDELDTILLSTSINKRNHYMPSYFRDGKLFFVGGHYDLSQEFRPSLESWGQYYFARLLSDYTVDQSAFLMRLPFVVMGLLSLFIIYITSIKAGIENKKKALLFLLILSCSGVFIFFRFARYYSLVFFFAALFNYAFINFIINPKGKILKHELFISIIAIIGLYFSHYLSFFLLLGGCVLFLIFHIKYLEKNRNGFLIFSLFVLLLLLHFSQTHLGGALLFAKHQSFNFFGYSKIVSILGNFSFKFLIFFLPIFLIKIFRKKINTYTNRFYLLSVFSPMIMLFLLSTMWRPAYWFYLFPLMILFCLINIDRINDKIQSFLFITCLSFSVFIFFIPFYSGLHSRILGRTISPSSTFEGFFNSLNSKDNMIIENSMSSYLFLKNYEFNGVGQLQSKYKNNFRNLSDEFFDDCDDFKYYVGYSYSQPDEVRVINGLFLQLIYIEKTDKHNNLLSNVIDFYRTIKFKITRNEMLLGSPINVRYYYIYEKAVI